MQYVVKKPWGTEYLLYRNPFVEIWRLTLRGGERTSLHCHPNKKTALIMVQGEAQFDTLQGSQRLGALDAAVIDAGAFHQTTALSADGITLLEVETPPAKHDLIRLRDEYGRQYQAYENLDHLTFDATVPRFSSTVDQIGLETCQVSVRQLGAGTLRPEHQAYLDQHDLLVILEGLISVDRNDAIYNIADIVPVDKLLRQREAVQLFNLTVLGIQAASRRPPQSVLARTFNRLRGVVR